ncbi:defensin-like protein 22 [Carica papaya]|uniref:defensin-like protein 22 n=1 Tax=Carica papaya TaxID=3649 RepID=UPI000B8CB1D7|nr:defensin-like protein 22 [Carica papaya]
MAYPRILPFVCLLLIFCMGLLNRGYASEVQYLTRSSSPSSSTNPKEEIINADVLCCNDNPQWGKCLPGVNDTACNAYCSPCSNHKGGRCKPETKHCHCFC